MNLKSKLLYLSFAILCAASFSGCNSSSPYTKTESTGPAERINTADNSNIADENTTENLPDSMNEAVTPLQPDDEPGSFSENNEALNQPDAAADEVVEPGDQGLIDSALEYCQAASEFLEQGDADNAIDALDKAYSYILKVEGADNPELLQQREDIRLTIANRIKEVYSTRYTAVNGNG